jgi:integrase
MGVFKRIRRLKNGKVSVYWYVRYRYRGKLYVKSVGPSGKVTKAVAEAFLAKIKEQIRFGRIDELRAEVPTLSEFAEEYLDYQRNTVRKRSWKRDVISLKNLCSVFGSRPLNTITPRDIQDYQTKRLREGKRPATVNRELACLKTLFNLAKQRRRFFGENPVSKVKFLEEANIKERILTPDEERRLLRELPEWIRPLVITALHTGMRRGELLKLRWEDVDLENRIITVESSHTKTKQTRKIPINSFLFDVLKEQKLVTGKFGLVFASPRAHTVLKNQTISCVFQCACRRAGIEGLRFHDLRHTAATRMIEAGAPVVAVSRILGHKNVLTTMRYAHPDSSLKDAVESLARLEKYNQKYSH